LLAPCSCSVPSTLYQCGFKANLGVIAALVAIRPRLSGDIAETADRTGFNACSSSPAPSTASKSASPGAARGRYLGIRLDSQRFVQSATGARSASKPRLSPPSAGRQAWRLEGLSANAIALELNKRGVATPTGSPWSAVTVIRVRRRLEAVS
jgi:Recombinase